MLVFFGYTHCPDVCPTTLLAVSSVLRRLGSNAGQVQAVFITVDPERDDAQTLADYVGAFDGDIVGLTGSIAAVRAAAASYHAHFRKVEQDRGPDAYLMEHPASIYLLDPNGEFSTVFVPGVGPEAIAQRLQGLLARNANPALETSSVSP